MKATRPLSYRQTRAIEFWLNGGRKSKAEAIRKASYSEAIARQPHKVFKSPAVEAYLEKRGFGSRGTRSSISPREILPVAPVVAVVSREATFDISKIPPEQIQRLKEMLDQTPDAPTQTRAFNRDHIAALATAQCTHCKNYTVWWYGALIYPATMPVESPSNDLPTEVKRDYEEAAQIVQKSPRAAAALLRLAIQKLCASLGGSGDNLNNDIAVLVQDGLPGKVQKMLDTVRVIGNHAVHPGAINLDDQPQTAEALFRLVNIIAEKMITEPKEIDALYGSLPEKDKEQIAKRDGQPE